MCCRGIDCLIRFKAICIEHDCEVIQAIGTSSIRNATNGKKFIDEVETKLQIPCRVIDGKQEAEMIYKGVCLTTSFENKGLIMDIGGGSTEFIYADKSGILKMKSFEIGVSRIYQKFQFSDPLSKDDIEKIFNYLDINTLSFFDDIECDDLF